MPLGYNPGSTFGGNNIGGGVAPHPLASTPAAPAPTAFGSAVGSAARQTMQPAPAAPAPAPAAPQVPFYLRGPGVTQDASGSYLPDDVIKRFQGNVSSKSADLGQVAQADIKYGNAMIRNQQALANGDPTTFERDKYITDLTRGDPKAAMESNPTAFMMAGDPNYAAQRAGSLDTMGLMVQGRQAPQLNAGATNMMFSGVGDQINAANAGGLMALGNMNNTAGVANGAGYQGQLATAQGLQGLANGQAVGGQMANAQALTNMATGPAPASMAQLQLAAGAQQSMQQQMAMAAGARGGNASLALQNAGQNQGQAMGQLNQSQALLRAQEELNNRNFSAGALQGASNIYNNAGQQQIGAMSAANQGFGGSAQTQLGAYGTAGQQIEQGINDRLQAAGLGVQMGNTYADMAKANAAMQLGMYGQNDQTMLGSEQLANQYLAQQLQASQNYDQNRTTNATNYAIGQYQGRDRSGEGTITGSGGGDKALAAGATAVATALPFLLSDTTAKKDKARADAEIADAYRQGDLIRNTNVAYPMATGSMPQQSQAVASFPDAPGYSYQYKQPTAAGAAPGIHYGPMAQDLEKTPAGASVVNTMPDGKKAIDTGRLSLLNTSELSRQRKELDALKAQAAAIMGAKVAYPQVAQPALAMGASPYSIGGV